VEQEKDGVRSNSVQETQIRGYAGGEALILMKIPYERQHYKTGNRMCGAAVIFMVLKSFRENCSQEKIWNEIKVSDGKGEYYAEVNKVCQFFLDRNFNSLHLSAKDPIELLKFCQKHSVPVILGHRLNIDSKIGHFTVFIKIVGNLVSVNDPDKDSKPGKGRKIKFSELLELMDGKGEVARNSCTIVTKKPLNIGHCGVCDSEIPLFKVCRHCNSELSLEPSLFIGCLDFNCSQALVNVIFCPHCNSPI